MQVRPLHHLRRNAVAYLALFVALGGTSVAATTLITGKNVKNSSLTGADVKNSSLTGGDVKNKSLTPSDFNGSVQGATGAQGPQGPQGGTGPQGLQGPKGDTGAPPPVEGYQTPTLLNDFDLYDEFADGTADVPVKFWKDPFGVVHLQGAVERASVPSDFTTIFRLPEGYRPDAEYVIFPVLTLGHNDTDEQLGNLQISSDGFVWYVGGKVGYFSVDGVTFRAAG